MKMKVAVIPGDGTGKEAVPEGARVLEAAGRRFGIDFASTGLDWGYEYLRVAAIKTKFPDVRPDQYHIDILCAHFVRAPERFDVVVGSNLFGDILSDLGPAVAGNIGIAPSANLNPERHYPSMFEPVHGSAPDIAGKGIANPIGQIWSGAVMLDHLGHKQAARAIDEAIKAGLPRKKLLTPDMGGKASTAQLDKAVADHI